MTEKEMSLVMGGLLHDIGKVLYRQGGEKRKHSQIGYEFLRDEGGIDNQDILDCVRYHHKDEMGKAALSADSLAYIVYIADNIASAADRRELDEEESEKGFEVHTPLQPVFNILNENKGNKYYSPGLLNMEASINYPADEKKLYTEEQYSKTVRNISDNLKGIEWKEEYLDSLLEVLEANLSYIPAATSKSEKQDISLFDHVKLTAAAASCILAYGKEKEITDYREAFYKNIQRFYEEKAFLLASLDMSGIQNFIYTIATKNALRTLRARSFYLEIMMEHLIDELLGKMGLSHGNLIYSGGGRCYMLLPNTEECRQVFDQFLADTLTISAGIGVYHDSYPVSAIAEEVAELEDASKKLPGKNGVTLFTDGESHDVISDEGRQMVKDGTYSWEELEDEVIGEKFSCIAAFFDASADRGNAFLYRLLELIRNQKERINFARYVYLLSRMEPADTADPEQKEAYRTFSRKMLQWIGSEKDRWQLKTAITVYVYLNRENGEEEHVEND